MKKRRQFGAYAQLVIAKDPMRLPQNLLVLLKNAISSGILHAPRYWRKRTQLEEDDFFENTLHFKQVADGNEPLFHILMACFLKTVRKEMKIKGVKRIFTRNFYIVGGMIQREMTQMCLKMHEDDLESSTEWMKYVEGIEEDHEEWVMDYRGALSAARAARLFVQKGIKVYLPTAFIDIQWRIDLIACVPKKPFGLCVQVKSHQTTPSMNYHLFHNHETNPREEESHKNDYLFVDGVAYFRDQTMSEWIPIEIEIGDSAYASDTIIPTPVMIKALDHMLKSVYAADATKLKPHISAPSEVLTAPLVSDVE